MSAPRSSIHGAASSRSPFSSLGKCKSTVDAVGGQAPQRRCMSAASTAAFSAATRNQIQTLNDRVDACWHCGATPKTDREFALYRARGLLSILSLGDVNNGILLCPLCHRNLDDMASPGFVFVPTDVNFFIEFEKSDANRRHEHLQTHYLR